MRVFVAILFDDEVKNKLCEAIQRLMKQSLKGNFTSRNNLHLTLAFIGETDDPGAIETALDTIDMEKFTLQLRGYGIFKRRTGNVHWAGVNVSDTLTALRNQVVKCLQEAGIHVDEEEEYRPHLTLGREVQPASLFNPATFARQMPVQEMTVEKISLMKSEYIDSKLTYTEIYAKELHD